MSEHWSRKWFGHWLNALTVCTIYLVVLFFFPTAVIFNKWLYKPPIRSAFTTEYDFKLTLPDGETMNVPRGSQLWLQVVDDELTSSMEGSKRQ